MIQQLTNFEASHPSFPIYPLNSYNSTISQQLTRFVEKYHYAPLIQLEDSIQFQNSEESLKRYYRASEFDNKIKLLGDYYRFHFEAPRMFLPGVERIIETNTQQKRTLQYEIVTQEVNRTKQGTSTLRMSTNRLEPHQKMIKDVQLSYKDFEHKPQKQQRQKLTNRNEHCYPKTNKRDGLKLYDKTERTLSRVASITNKNSFMVFKPKENKKSHPEKNNKVGSKGKEQTFNFKKPTNSHKAKLSQNRNTVKNKEKSSKMTSVNNSINSQGMSRSKSKANLEIKSHNLKSKQSSMNTSQQKFQKASISNKSSLQKNTSNKNMLSQKKNLPENSLSRKGSRNDLMSYGQDCSKSKVSHKVITIHGSKKNTDENRKATKKSTVQEEKKNVKTMFNKAIEIRRRV